MASTGSVFSQTLHSITTTKLDELSKKRGEYEAQYSAIKANLLSEENPLKRLYILIDGVKTAFGAKTLAHQRAGEEAGPALGKVIAGTTGNPRLEVDLGNLDRFLEQARYDPSVSSKRLAEWEHTMSQYLSVQSVRYQYATLYGQLVTEWLSVENKSSEPPEGDAEMSDAFEKVPTAKKMDSRADWEQSVFEAAEIDKKSLKAFLKTLFGEGTADKIDVWKAFKALQQRVEQFESQMAFPNQFNHTTLKWTIQGLLASDLLSDEKRAVLKDFNGNSTILTEIADVLNMRMASMTSWSWGDGVTVEQRRMLNGNYNIHMQEDLLQAIFLQYIGVKWSVFFKGALVDFYQNNTAWTPLSEPISDTDKKRLDYYLGPNKIYPNVQTRRKKLHMNNYFLYQLPDNEQQDVVVEEGEEEADYAALAHDTRAPARAAAPKKMMRMMGAAAPISRGAVMPSLGG
jgi:hypothetical protein